MAGRSLRDERSETGRLWGGSSADNLTGGVRSNRTETRFKPQKRHGDRYGTPQAAWLPWTTCRGLHSPSRLGSVSCGQRVEGCGPARIIEFR